MTNPAIDPEFPVGGDALEEHIARCEQAAIVQHFGTLDWDPRLRPQGGPGLARREAATTPLMALSVDTSVRSASRHMPLRVWGA